VRTLILVPLLIACTGAVVSGQQAQKAPAPAQPAPAPSAGAGQAPPASAGQTPSTGSAQAAKPAEKPAEQPTEAPAEAYSYNPDGRRDPFTSLIGTGSAADNRTTRRADGGAAALTVNEISVRGILQSRGALVAMVQGPDNKTYIVHQGDKLLDGVIKTITPQGLVLIQEVNDPLSLVKQREVSKLLRSLEGGK